MDGLEPDNVERWVPMSLKESIMGDSELGLQQISKGAWNPDDTDPVVDRNTLDVVKDIFLCARGYRRERRGWALGHVFRRHVRDAGRAAGQ